MPVISGGVVGQPGRILFEEITFTEEGAAGTYTGSVTVPGNSWLLDIKIYNLTYWGAGTSAKMLVGDADDPNGWFDDINLLTTDIVDYTTDTNAEVIDFNNAGGKVGVYLVAATGERELMYAATERVITGLVTTVGTTATAGRTRMIVIYTDPTTPTAATYAAT
jgi:hypothetical protein